MKIPPEKLARSEPKATEFSLETLQNLSFEVIGKLMIIWKPRKHR